MPVSGSDNSRCEHALFPPFLMFYGGAFSSSLYSSLLFLCNAFSAETALRSVTLGAGARLPKDTFIISIKLHPCCTISIHTLYTRSCESHLVTLCSWVSDLLNHVPLLLKQGDQWEPSKHESVGLNICKQTNLHKYRVNLPADLWHD